MERIRALINKLQQQAEQQADVAAMMVTVQLLQAELTKASATAPYVAGPSKISVVLPGGSNPSHYAYKPVPEPEAELAEESVVPNHFASSAWVETSHYNVAKSVPDTVETTGWVPDPLAEAPLPAEQKKEMNEIWGKPAQSLNDRLKTDQTELGSTLTDAPVKDLKKAIGINDRFVFLNELFRGDETMYERSIKTINNFRAYPEAEYWIERELKIKLGWDENRETVKYFRQLVRRRFF